MCNRRLFDDYGVYEASEMLSLDALKNELGSAYHATIFDSEGCMLVDTSIKDDVLHWRKYDRMVRRYWRRMDKPKYSELDFMNARFAR